MNFVEIFGILVGMAALIPKGNAMFQQPVFDDDEDKLLKGLFKYYNPELRPVVNKRDKVTVKFGISLHQIVDLHEKNQILKASLWVRQSWHNPFLVWNASLFGGIKEINVKPDKVWRPDIYLYNNADERVDGALDRFNTKIVVNSEGWCKWLAPIIVSSSCKIDVKYFPFDAQHCRLKFGSWTYDGFKLDMIQEGPEADTKKFVANGEWDLISFPAKRNELYYICCIEPYPDVTYTLNIRRKPIYYYINIIIPCLVITALTLLSFYLPPDSGERITLVITNLLALTVFMLLVAEIMPSTSEVVPLISIYYTCTIIEVGIALVATCIVLKFYFHDPAISDMPAWVRIIVLTWLARLLKYNIARRRISLKKNSLYAEVSDARGRDYDLEQERFLQHRVDHASRDGLNTLQPSLSTLHLSNGHVTKPRLTIGSSTRRDSFNTRRKEFEERWSLLNDSRKSSNPTTDTNGDRFSRLIDSQSGLLNSVNTLVRQTNAKELMNERKKEWVLAASIVDQTCFVLFLVMLFSSTVIIFTQAY